MCIVVIEKLAHFTRVTSSKGIKINGITFKRFVGTTGGLKNNSLVLISESILDELNRRVECGRDSNVKLVPAKYEAYKALSCSASQPIIEPNRILVIPDVETKFKDHIISLDNSCPTKDSPIMTEIPDADIKNTACDGVNLCTPDYMQLVSESLGIDYATSGVCLRNAWLKGMMYSFPIIEFIEKYHLNEDGTPDYFIRDIWGELQDIREIDMIISESSLKLWSAYKNVDDYMTKYKENGFGFAVTKIISHKQDDQRELNYQYIQSYDLDDEDIKELCQPTIQNLKNALCGDYESTLKFIGGSSDGNFTWQQALKISPYMLQDPYVVDCIHRMIKKKIDGAKIGKLVVNGNYQLASGDPVLMMEYICGLEPKGLLKANEIYSSYWSNRGVDEVVVLRSPMTCHSNIRKCKVISNEEVDYWYQYMDGVVIVNGWDTFCQAENGCDYDGDILFTTNNPVLLRKHRELPAVVCAQSTAEKKLITEADILKSNKNGMGNDVGVITNRVTGMMEVQSRFPKGSREYNELAYRISSGQLYQQDSIDKIKGIVAKPMPHYWYSPKACNDLTDRSEEEIEYLKSIALDKKPYFMIYVYEDYKKKLKTFITSANIKCMDRFNLTLEELLNKVEPTEEEASFIEWYNKKHPFGIGPCAMNKVCWYVENELDSYKHELKANSSFDYNRLKKQRRCTNEHRALLNELLQDYVVAIKAYKNKKNEPTNIYIGDKEATANSRILLADYFRRRAKEICPNDDERLNIILDLCYQYRNNMQFCWDTIGDLICERLKEINIEEAKARLLEG